MWKNKKRKSGRTGNRERIALWLLAICLLCGLFGGCGQNRGKAAALAVPETEPESSATEPESSAAEPKASMRIGLILTSRDDPENESVEAVFQELADRLGAELRVKTPDVSAAEADEARKLAYHTFVLCDVDPIEYQMLAVNELVAENVDVIAIHANHEEALESVLSAARGVGIRVIAFGQEVTEESCDEYAKTAEQAALEIE